MRTPQPENRRVAEQVPHDGLGLVVVDDAAPQQVADVGRERVDLPLLAVQREREAAALREPEVAVEARLAPPLPVRAARPAPRRPRSRARAARSAAWRRTRSPGSRRRRAAAARACRRANDDRVPRVLPALVLEAGLGVAPLVLDVAVAVAVAVLVDPLERRARRGLELAHQVGVARPALVLVEHTRNSGVESAEPKYGECGRSSNAVSSPKRSSCRILPGSSSRKASTPVAWKRASDAQRRLRELGRRTAGLIARDQAVAAEERHEPRKARGRHSWPSRRTAG